MAIRTARTDWNGTLQDGSGRTELTSSGVGTFDVSWPRRTGDTADGVTSPEELIAAAHSSCYSMALSNEIAKAGGTPRSLPLSCATRSASLVPRRERVVETSWMASMIVDLPLPFGPLMRSPAGGSLSSRSRCVRTYSNWSCCTRAAGCSKSNRV